LSNAKYKYVKIQRKIFLEDDLAMILLILVCYVAVFFVKLSPRDFMFLRFLTFFIFISTFITPMFLCIYLHSVQ